MNNTIGTKITTTKGFIFELVEIVAANNRQSWKDLSTNIIWHDIIRNDFTHYNAVLHYDVVLPTIDDLTLAESHGFREVLPNMGGFLYWPRELVQGLNHGNMFFNGSNGQFTVIPLSLGSVRIITRR